MTKLLLVGALAGMLSLSSCSVDSGDAHPGFSEANDDLLAVARQLGGLVTASEPIGVRRCRDEGSGPQQPGTNIDLQLEPGVAESEVAAATTAALVRMDYRVLPTQPPILVAARRGLGNGRAIEVRLYDTSSSVSDLMLASSLPPPVVC